MKFISNGFQLEIDNNKFLYIISAALNRIKRGIRPGSIETNYEGALNGGITGSGEGSAGRTDP